MDLSHLLLSGFGSFNAYCSQMMSCGLCGCSPRLEPTHTRRRTLVDKTPRPQHIPFMTILKEMNSFTTYWIVTHLVAQFLKTTKNTSNNFLPKFSKERVGKKGLLSIIQFPCVGKAFTEATNCSIL